MKIAANFVVSLAALGALLAAATSQATNVAELPLKAAVLAKPNVVFAMDESGSMDAEVMIDGHFQGWFYGNYGSNDLYPGGKPRTGSASYDWNMFYLFPNGTGSGNRVYGDADARYGYAIPPTPQLAWTRSSDYNTLYYNSNKTYEPWSPGYVSGGAATTFGAASSTAAKSHPVNGTTTMALNASLASNTANWRFTFTSGMSIPADASNVTCLWGTNPTPPVANVSTSNGLCTATVPYYPATFWVKQACTADGSSCVTNYDGNTLKRYEIKTGVAFPSGRSYADELQNFANWFTYYRKRRLMLGAAMGDVLENLSGLRLGVVAFNVRTAPTMYDADAASPSANRLAVTGRFYTAEGSGGTPTHATMAYIRDQFDTNTGIIQYACQRNSTFIITDGFANDGAVAPPSYSQTTYGGTRPYQSITGSSLADKALAYFTLRLRASGGTALPAGKVPPGPSGVTNPDTNRDLHLTTYALTLGMKGTLWPTAVDPFVTFPTWTVPASNTATMIDDLWHATINGRGQMYLATDVAGTAEAIRAGLQDILSQTGAQGGVAVSTVNLQRGDGKAYFGTYNPAGWTGDLTANTISAETGDVSTTASWSAAALLNARDWTTRVIASHNGTAGVAFAAADVGGIVNPSGTWGTTSEVMDYLRGRRTLEGTTFRKRTSLIGAVINAEPAVSREDGVAYLASGEGMLHAIDIRDDVGKELWAFVPRAVLPDMGQTTARGYSFKTQLDGSPVIGKASATTRVLVAGLGAAGRSYYALDVTSPRGLSESGLAGKVKWEFPSASDTTTIPKVGQTVGRPVIVQASDGTFAVLVTSGYNNTADGKGRMWMLNPATGAVIHEFVTTDGTLSTESGLTHVSPFVESDGKVRYVFGGDLLGNVWKFDLVAKTTAKVAVLKDASGNLQPVTAAPELVYHESKRIVLIGTGRLLDISDFGSSATQTFYAISDGATLSNARTSLVAQIYTRASDTITSNPVDWGITRGWYVDLPAGEQANTRPVVTRGGVAFVTNVAGASDCSASSYLYLVNLLNGQKYTGATFVGTQISATANSSGLNALLTSGGGGPGGGGGGGGGGGTPPCQHIVGSGQTSDGTPWKRDLTSCVDITPRKNAWREIRRQ